MASPPSTTCAFVRMCPFRSITKPEPNPPPSSPSLTATSTTAGDSRFTRSATDRAGAVPPGFACPSASAAATEALGALATMVPADSRMIVVSPPPKPTVAPTTPRATPAPMTAGTASAAMRRAGEGRGGMSGALRSSFMPTLYRVIFRAAL